MLSIVKSMNLYGLRGVIINVEVDVSNGFPCWEIVGLPDTNIKESKERVNTALKNCGVKLESRKYIINLSPATLRKKGGYYDLSIAIGIMLSIGYINNKKVQALLETTVFIGELSLDGKINSVKGMIAFCIEAKRLGIKNIVAPYSNYKEASAIEGMNIIAVKDIREVIDYLNTGKTPLYQENINTQEDTNLKEVKSKIDFSDVIGQRYAKRALEIAVAGGHNCLLIGTPGSGKTMMAHRVKTIMPKPSIEESVEITKIQSICGISGSNGLASERPFRNPSRNITLIGLIGGGRYPVPGEITLAHLGVLFFDEILEFDSNLLDALRIPIENKEIGIKRNDIDIVYPSSFILIGSANPCPCGYFGSKDRVCKCTEYARKRYMNKLSGPMLDRFDIRVSVKNIDYKDEIKSESEPSQSIKSRVERAREIQASRYIGENYKVNGDLDENGIKRYCMLDKESEMILDKGAERLKLSMRAYSKIKKVARTIADIEGEEKISKRHILEAMQYRKEL